jgi:hypothetical protein
MVVLISQQIIREQLRDKLGHSAVSKNGFIGVKSLYMPIVGSPAHPFWFRRQIPFVRIEIG